MTAREASVLVRICTGLAHKEVSHQLHIAQSTVAQHIESIRRKLGARNRPGMVGRAFVLGFVRSDRWPPTFTGENCIDVNKVSDMDLSEEALRSVEGTTTNDERST